MYWSFGVFISGIVRDIVTRPVGSFISFCSEVKAGNTCILDVLGSEGEQTPHQVVVRASTFGLYQQLAWNLFIGWLQWDMSHLFFRCWNVGFLAGVKQSGVHRLSGASRHGLRCWAFTRVTGSSLGEWDPLAVGKWWRMCLAWKACSSCAWLWQCPVHWWRPYLTHHDPWPVLWLQLLQMQGIFAIVISLRSELWGGIQVLGTLHLRLRECLQRLQVVFTICISLMIHFLVLGTLWLRALNFLCYLCQTLGPSWW